MKQIIFSCLLLLSVNLIKGQEITPKITASSGHYYGIPGSLEVSYTIGEMTSVSLVASAAIGITQGFHQPEEMQSLPGLVKSIYSQQINLSVYPNPVLNTVWVEYEIKRKGTTEILLIDVNGKITSLSKIVNNNSDKSINQFDVSKISNGDYFIQLKFAGNDGLIYSATKQILIIH